MAYNPETAARVLELLAGIEALDEKKMFGGVAYLIHGNMVCGVIGDQLMVRVGPAEYERALSQPHAAVFDFTGRPMKGWVSVSPEGTREPEELRSWVNRGLSYARSLPPK